MTFSTSGRYAKGTGRGLHLFGCNSGLNFNEICLVAAESVIEDFAVLEKHRSKPGVLFYLVNPAFAGFLGSLRGSANFLMALICLCELVHQIGHTFFLVVVVSGTNFVSLLTADLLMTPMIFALNCGLMAMFCAAFDRLFAVALPFKHSSIFIKYKFPYLLAHVFICVIYGALIQYFVLDYAFENAGNPTTGMVAESLQGPVGHKFFAGTFIISLGSTCCYMSIFVFTRCKNGVTQQTNTRVLRSLVIILSINIGGYLVNLVMYQLMDAFGSLLGPPIRAWQFGFVAGILLNAAAGSNAIVLYFCSTEYRQVFKKELGSLFGRFRKNNVVQIIGTPQKCNINPINNDAILQAN
ncbi:hypothetical protein niasHS_001376 [Heterodera schachtii]|uniref:G_PROTEIN_RECEP_F1_2 domain-containing protein n=1 Tax=Heterodera schachtii TaxID=97005 RepID=A0ABD2KDJ0_HETSC